MKLFRSGMGARRAMRSSLLLGGALTTLLLLSTKPTTVNSKAILGVDLGSLYMKVALVQRNSPLEIVTNLHSKRKTEQMVLFDQGSRFYGADASSLLARKPHLTPSSMSLMLGRDSEHPSVQVLAERHYPLRPSYNETRSGVCLTVDGADFTPEELVAMVLTHAKDITAAFGDSSSTAMVRDCVLTVPSFYTQHERRALLDAAALADLNVLALIDENTAAALHFGMDRIDAEPHNVLFYNMGASALQVSVVTFHSYEYKEGKYGKARTVGAFEVRGKGWDLTLGGQAFDARLVEYMADEFNREWNAKTNDGETKDVRVNSRAMTKLRLQANKVKHVLSANTDIPVFIDSLHDDTNFQLHVTRAEFEQLCHDLLHRSVAPIEAAVAAAGLTMDDVDSVELIGGGMRIPRVQEEIASTLGGRLDLGMHINSDESMALGAAFHGANVSTAFRVRHVGMTDVNPFPIGVTLESLADVEKKGGGGLGGLFGVGKKKAEEAAAKKDGEEEDDTWRKQATLFKSFGKVGVKKTIAFTQDHDVHCSLDYEDADILPEGTERSLLRYNITGIAKFAEEMAEKGLGKPKVTLQFELSTSGISHIIKAEAAVEETVMVKEEVEVDDDEDEGEDAGEGKEGEDAKDEKTDNPDQAATEESKEDDDAGEGSAEGSKDGDGDGEEKNETEAKKDDDAKTEDKEKKTKKKKKKKTKVVEKEQKKITKRTLDVKTYHTGRIQPYSDDIMAESKAKLVELAEKDKARMMLEEAKNKFESYIYLVKNKLIDDEEVISKVSTEEQRADLLKLAEDAGEWLDFEGYDADLPTYEERYLELSEPAEKIFFRVAESTSRPDAVAALRKKLGKVEDLMTKWETTLPQVTEEERADVLAKVAEVRTNLEEKEKAQAEADPSEAPVFTSKEVPLLTKPLESLITKLNKKPKPKPIVEEKKNDTESEEEKAGNETGDETGDGNESEAAPNDSSESTQHQEEEKQGEQTEENMEDEQKTDTQGSDEKGKGEGDEL